MVGNGNMLTMDIKSIPVFRTREIGICRTKVKNILSIINENIYKATEIFNVKIRLVFCFIFEYCVLVNRTKEPTK